MSVNSFTNTAAAALAAAAAAGGAASLPINQLAQVSLVEHFDDNGHQFNTRVYGSIVS